MEEMLWPEDFEEIDVEQCDSPRCERLVSYGANMNYPGETKLCDEHHTKWCRDYNQRPEEGEDPPERLSFKVYFAEEVPLP